MTLLVADDNRRSLRDVLPSDAVTVEAEAVADAVARDDPDVVVVDAAAVADAAGIVESVRANAPSAAVVAVGTTNTGADVSCAATDESSICAAVERARQVADYRRSVSDLYEACRDRALGRPDDDLRDCRRDADAKFEQLPTDRETFSAALRPDTGDGAASDADENSSRDGDEGPGIADEPGETDG